MFPPKRDGYPPPLEDRREYRRAPYLPPAPWPAAVHDGPQSPREQQYTREADRGTYARKSSYDRGGYASPRGQRGSYGQSYSPERRPYSPDRERRPYSPDRDRRPYSPPPDRLPDRARYALERPGSFRREDPYPRRDNWNYRDDARASPPPQYPEPLSRAGSLRDLPPHVGGTAFSKPLSDADLEAGEVLHPGTRPPPIRTNSTRPQSAGTWEGIKSQGSGRLYPHTSLDYPRPSSRSGLPSVPSSSRIHRTGSQALATSPRYGDLLSGRAFSPGSPTGSDSAAGASRKPFLPFSSLERRPGSADRFSDRSGSGERETERRRSNSTLQLLPDVRVASVDKVVVGDSDDDLEPGELETEEGEMPVAKHKSRAHPSPSANDRESVHSQHSAEAGELRPEKETIPNVDSPSGSLSHSESPSRTYSSNTSSSFSASDSDTSSSDKDHTQEPQSVRREASPQHQQKQLVSSLAEHAQQNIYAADRPPSSPRLQSPEVGQAQFSPLSDVPSPEHMSHKELHHQAERVLPNLQQLPAPEPAPGLPVTKLPALHAEPPSVSHSGAEPDVDLLQQPAVLQHTDAGYLVTSTQQPATTASVPAVLPSSHTPITCPPADFPTSTTISPPTADMPSASGACATAFDQQPSHPPPMQATATVDPLSLPLGQALPSMGGTPAASQPPSSSGDPDALPPSLSFAQPTAPVPVLSLPNPSSTLLQDSSSAATLERKASAAPSRRFGFGISRRAPQPAASPAAAVASKPEEENLLQKGVAEEGVLTLQPPTVAENGSAGVVAAADIMEVDLPERPMRAASLDGHLAVGLVQPETHVADTTPALNTAMVAIVDIGDREHADAAAETAPATHQAVDGPTPQAAMEVELASAAAVQVTAGLTVDTPVMQTDNCAATPAQLQQESAADNLPDSIEQIEVQISDLERHLGDLQDNQREASRQIGKLDTALEELEQQLLEDESPSSSEQPEEAEEVEAPGAEEVPQAATEQPVAEPQGPQKGRRRGRARKAPPANTHIQTLQRLIANRNRANKPDTRYHGPPEQIEAAVRSANARLALNSQEQLLQLLPDPFAGSVCMAYTAAQSMLKSTPNGKSMRAGLVGAPVPTIKLKPLYQGPSNLPAVEANAQRHEAVKGAALRYLQERRALLQAKHDALVQRYEQRRDSFKQHMESAMATKRALLHSPGTGRAASRVLGDFARTDLDETRVIHNLQAVDVLQQQVALPDQLLDPWERRWRGCINTNRLVAEPARELAEEQASCVWTKEEAKEFAEVFLEHPKDFRKIASVLGRTTGEVVSFFYKNQKSEIFDRARNKLRTKKRQLKIAEKAKNSYLTVARGRGAAAAQNQQQQEQRGRGAAATAAAAAAAVAPTPGIVAAGGRGGRGRGPGRGRGRPALVPEPLPPIGIDIASPAPLVGFASQQLPPLETLTHTASGTVLKRTAAVAELGDANKWVDADFIESVRAVGRDFVQMSQILGKSSNACKNFFYKNRARLRLDDVLNSRMPGGPGAPDAVENGYENGQGLHAEEELDDEGMKPDPDGQFDANDRGARQQQLTDLLAALEARRASDGASSSSFLHDLLAHDPGGRRVAQNQPMNNLLSLLASPGTGKLAALNGLSAQGAAPSLFTGQQPPQASEDMDQLAASGKRPNQWSEAEKQTFMQIYKVHGKDWERLCAAIPNKTKAQIKTYFQNYKSKLGFDKMELPATAVQPGQRTRGRGRGGRATPAAAAEADDDYDDGPLADAPALVAKHVTGQAGAAADDRLDSRLHKRGRQEVDLEEERGQLDARLQLWANADGQGDTAPSPLDLSGHHAAGSDPSGLGSHPVLQALLTRLKEGSSNASRSGNLPDLDAAPHLFAPNPVSGKPQMRPVSPLQAPTLDLSAPTWQLPTHTDGSPESIAAILAQLQQRAAQPMAAPMTLLSSGRTGFNASTAAHRLPSQFPAASESHNIVHVLTQLQQQGMLNVPPLTAAGNHTLPPLQLQAAAYPEASGVSPALLQLLQSQQAHAIAPGLLHSSRHVGPLSLHPLDQQLQLGTHELGLGRQLVLGAHRGTDGFGGLQHAQHPLQLDQRENTSSGAGDDGVRDVAKRLVHVLQSAEAANALKREGRNTEPDNPQEGSVLAGQLAHSSQQNMENPDNNDTNLQPPTKKVRIEDTITDASGQQQVARSAGDVPRHLMLSAQLLEALDQEGMLNGGSPVARNRVMPLNLAAAVPSNSVDMLRFAGHGGTGAIALSDGTPPELLHLLARQQHSTSQHGMQHGTAQQAILQALGDSGNAGGDNDVDVGMALQTLMVISRSQPPQAVSRGPANFALQLQPPLQSHVQLALQPQPQLQQFAGGSIERVSLDQLFQGSIQRPSAGETAVAGGAPLFLRGLPPQGSAPSIIQLLQQQTEPAAARGQQYLYQLLQRNPDHDG